MSSDRKLSSIKEKALQEGAEAFQKIKESLMELKDVLGSRDYTNNSRLMKERKHPARKFVADDHGQLSLKPVPLNNESTESMYSMEDRRIPHAYTVRKF
jgi:hypothetical protein